MPETRRYTVYARFPSGEVEEIDVDAISPRAARATAMQELDRDYNSGWKIIKTEERFGLYF